MCRYYKIFLMIYNTLLIFIKNKKFTIIVGTILYIISLYYYNSRYYSIIIALDLFFLESQEMHNLLKKETLDPPATLGEKGSILEQQKNNFKKKLLSLRKKDSPVVHSSLPFHQTTEKNMQDMVAFVEHTDARKIKSNDSIQLNTLPHQVSILKEPGMDLHAMDARKDLAEAQGLAMKRMDSSHTGKRASTERTVGTLDSSELNMELSMDDPDRSYHNNADMISREGSYRQYQIELQDTIKHTIANLCTT